MNAIIFILAIHAVEVCKGPLEQGFGMQCNYGWKYHYVYTVNSKPCWDEGMNKKIKDDKLSTYKTVYQTVVNPDGSTPYCPKKARFKKFNLKEVSHVPVVSESFESERTDW